MTVEYKGSGDPERSLALLWRTRREPTRGPKPSLDIDDIVAAAIDIADSEGLPAVTMRRIAQRLNVGAMSLYTYVPGKAELLDLMLDQVYGDQPLHDVEAESWHSRIEACAREDWSLYQRHPWVLQVSEARALLGPNELARFERALRSVANVGLSGREMVFVVNLVASFVRGAAQVSIDSARAADQTGLTDQQWWAARSPILDLYFDASRYPTLADINLEREKDPVCDAPEESVRLVWESFEFGLDRILDGIEALLHRRRAVDPTFDTHL